MSTMRGADSPFAGSFGLFWTRKGQRNSTRRTTICRLRRPEKGTAEAKILLPTLYLMAISQLGTTRNTKLRICGTGAERLTFCFLSPRLSLQSNRNPYIMPNKHSYFNRPIDESQFTYNPSCGCTLLPPPESAGRRLPSCRNSSACGTCAREQGFGTHLREGSKRREMHDLNKSSQVVSKVLRCVKPTFQSQRLDLAKHMLRVEQAL